MSFNT